MLTYERRHHPELFGAYITYSEIEDKLSNFRAQLREIGALGQPLYFVCCDVERAFDNIEHAQLLSRLRLLISHDDYCATDVMSVCGYSVPIRDVDGCTRTMFNKVKQKKFRMCGQTIECSRTLFTSLTQRAGKAVFCEQSSSQCLSRIDVLRAISDHITNNCVHFNGGVYRQHRGVPQGSSLSSLLCGLYYADVDEYVSTTVTTAPRLFIRMVDDYLFISPDRHATEVCYHKLKQRLKINDKKTKTNLEHSMDSIPYCGLCIDIHSLRVSVHMSDVRLVYVPNKEPAVAIATMLRSQMHNKLVMLVHECDSISTVSEQLNKLFDFCAQRVHLALRNYQYFSVTSELLIRLFILFVDTAFNSAMKSGMASDVIMIAADSYRRVIMSHRGTYQKCWQSTVYFIEYFVATYR